MIDTILFAMGLKFHFSSMKSILMRLMAVGFILPMHVSAQSTICGGNLYKLFDMNKSYRTFRKPKNLFNIDYHLKRITKYNEVERCRIITNLLASQECVAKEFYWIEVSGASAEYFCYIDADKILSFDYDWRLNSYTTKDTVDRKFSRSVSGLVHDIVNGKFDWTGTNEGNLHSGIAFVAKISLIYPVESRSMFLKDY
jgi:hypothetical protein